MKCKKAYTLIEVTLVLALIAMIAGIASPIFFSQLNNERVKFEAENLSSLIFATQQDAYTGKNMTSHGIKLETTKFTIFEGASFSSATVKEEFVFKNKVNITAINLTGGSSEIVFPQGSFRPTSFGTITLSDGLSNFIVEINSEGLTNFYKI